MSFFNELFGTAKDVVSLPINIIRNPTNAGGTLNSAFGSLNNTVNSALNTAKGLTTNIPGVNTVSQYIPSGGGSAATVTGNVVGGF